MTASKTAYSPPVRIRPYILALTLVWSAVTVLSLFWNVFHIKEKSLDLVVIQARESIKKDILYRRWNAMHGSVYVPITETTPANPYLDLPNRDIRGGTALALTLINPAYMTRQVHEMAAEEAGTQGHITSLNPIRKENAPDKWEAEALDAFEQGAQEFKSVETVHGIKYLRLMQPLVTEQSCLKCHAVQGYRTGDVRGGISVSVPMGPFREMERSHIVSTSMEYVFLWMAGLGLIGFGVHRLNWQLTEQHQRATTALTESEAKYRRIFRASVAAIFVLDAQKRFLDANPAGLDLLGCSREELLRMRISDFDADPYGAFPADRLLMNGQKLVNYEHCLKRKDGRIITVLNNSIPLADASGDVVGLQSMLINITSRRKAEQRLNENQARLRTLIDAMPDLVWLKDPNGVYMACNTRFERFIGKKEQAIIGKDDYHFMDKHQAEFFRHHDKLAMAKGGPNINEEEVVFADDGHHEILETIKTPVHTEDGHLIGVLGIGRNITERKINEKIQAAKLRLIDFATAHTTTELLQRFLDEAESLTESSIGFYHFVEEDQQTLSLQTWSTHTLNGLCAADGAGRHYPVSKAGVWVDCVRERKPVVHNDYGSLSHKKGLPEGHVPVVRELVVPVLRKEKIRAILGVGNKMRDYTDNDVEIVQQLADLSWETVIYKRAEDAQRESEEKYRSMMEAMTDAAYICSPDFHIKYQNPAMTRRIGRDAAGDICYRVINSLDEKCPWCPMDKVMGGSNVKMEVKSPMDDRYYQVSSSPVLHSDGTVSKMTIYTDVTQIKEAEGKLRQAQKLEALGTLAGGIAHDFNNMLAPIMGLSEMLAADLPAGGFEHENAVDILKSAKRASYLVQQILSFSRQSEQKRIPLRIQQILKEVFKLMRSTIPANISIHHSIQAECGQVLADPTQIHQIAMNLITNAYHAVEEGGGSITIGLEENSITEAVSEGFSLTPGRYARMSVADTGCGIAPALLEKIFEPYFTTKAHEKGTGLGLSVVYGLVKDHGGNIRVQSTLGKGAAFDVYLPIIDGGNEADKPEESAAQLPMGSERILLVDDERAILKMESAVLRRLGYEVTVSKSSPDALTLFKTQPDAFDLVITDMTMPSMTGDQLTLAMLEIRPDVSIIICTGFSEKIDRERADAIGIKGFLKKPITRSELAGMVRKVLDEAKAEGAGIAPGS